MQVTPELLELTNKFLSDFFELCNKQDTTRKRDDLYAFNFVLPDAIAQSNYPKYEDERTILMGMSSFDDSIAKNMFNNRIQGFIPIIEKRLEDASKYEDVDDYYVKNIITTDYLKDDEDFIFSINENGKRDFTIQKIKTPAQTVSFDVINSRSGFEGKCVLYKSLQKVFINENDYTTEMITDEVRFYVNNQEVMVIRYSYDIKNDVYCEEGSFTHYKYIADINSFYTVLTY